MKSFITGFARVCGLVAVCALASNASADFVTWHKEHGDIGIAFEDGELELHFHFEDGLNGRGPEVEFDPGQVYVRVGDSARETVGGPVPFLGVDTGEDIWILPQGNTGANGADALGLPFMGIATEELSPADFTSMSLSLTGFSGPGEFAIWQDVGLTRTVLMQTQDGISVADSLVLPIGDHDHFNYGFTAEGRYEIELTATGTMTDGSMISDTEIFQFAVGSSTAVPEPNSLLLVASVGAFGAFIRRRRRA
ncbi:MAG: choice-of-anchor M domain-containing protein [Planctomycetota bacterium]